MAVFHGNAPLKWPVWYAKSRPPQGSTPEINLGHPRASGVQVDGPRLTPAEIMSTTLLRGLSGGGK